MLVLAQQQGLMGDGQVDEFLVVGVAAGETGLYQNRAVWL